MLTINGEIQRDKIQVMLKETGLGFGNRIVFLHPATVEVDVFWRSTRKSLKHFAVSGECGVFEIFQKKKRIVITELLNQHMIIGQFLPRQHPYFFPFIYIYIWGGGFNQIKVIKKTLKWKGNCLELI
jgi:hypothetical protein